MNHEQSSSLKATTRTEATHELTYSVARSTEVTTWQSVNTAFLTCHCSQSPVHDFNTGTVATIPTLFPCFLLICYPYISLIF